MYLKILKSASAATVLLLLTVGGTAGYEASPAKSRLTAAVELLDIWIEEQRSHREIPGLVVGLVLDQDLVWSKGYGYSDLESKAFIGGDSIFRIGSITKLFTATAIMQLRDQGKLALEDSVQSHLPWFRLATTPDSAAEPITVRQLLTHTAGLSREAAFPYWTTHEFPSGDELREVVPTQAAIYPPATKYKYSNLGIALLGDVVAQVSGLTFANYVDQNILAPLGMSNTSANPSAQQLQAMVTRYMRRMPDGSRKIFDYYSMNGMAAAGDMVSTVNDLARFAALQFRTEPQSQGPKVLKASTIREMQRVHWVYPSWTGGRGLGFGISRKNGKSLVSHGGWIGGSRSHLLLIPEDKVAVIAMLNADDGSPSLFTNEIYRIVATRLLNSEGPTPIPAEPDPLWQKFLGSYSDPWGWEYKVILLNGKLMMYEHSYPPEDRADGSLSSLTPVADNIFRLADGELVEFEIADDGSVQRVRRRFEYLFPTKQIDSKQTLPGL